MGFEHLHEKYKVDLLEKIKIAANIGDSDTIKKCSEMFEKLDKVKLLFSEISNEFKALENFLNKKDTEPIKKLSPKKKGEKRVSDFIKKMHNIGINLNQWHNYCTRRQIH